MDLERAAGRLRASGRRVTAQRWAVLRALTALGCAVDVEGIHARAQRMHPRLGLVTVYRALEALAAEGLARPVFLGDGRTRYETAEQERHHHHLVCLRCGRIAALESCTVRPLEGTILKKGFRVTTHRLELFGYCRRCRRDSEARQTRRAEGRR